MHAHNMCHSKVCTTNYETEIASESRTNYFSCIFFSLLHGVVVREKKEKEWKYSLNETVSLRFIFVLLAFLVDTHGVASFASAGIGGSRPL